STTYDLNETGTGDHEVVIGDNNKDSSGTILTSAMTEAISKRRRRHSSSDYDSSDDENPLKHLKVHIEDSIKKFLAQNHESSRDHEKNSKKRKNLGFTQKSAEITWCGQGNRRQFEFNEQMLDDLHYLKSYVSRGSSSSQEKARQLIEDMDESILHHQKLIRIAN
uniref:Uncharacterized protein n=1 Tax=Romanomermis culicivorax TaxID=13658 RepID=A0A915JQ20_ROMCU